MSGSPNGIATTESPLMYTTHFSKWISIRSMVTIVKKINCHSLTFDLANCDTRGIFKC